MSRYAEVYRRSLEDPEGFWGEAAAALEWHRPPAAVLDRSDPPFYRWFPGGEINMAHNALDRHVEAGRGGQAALIYDSPITGTVRSYTYLELRDLVARCAGALRRLGVETGDRVVLYMPMIPEAVVAMLACARIGAIHSVVFGGFAPAELASRIDDAKPKLIVSASCGLEPGRVVAYKPMLDEALRLAVHKPAGTLVKQRPQAAAALLPGRDHDWDDAMAAAADAPAVPVPATHPLYILYTSGTTGQPKGIVRDTGGYMAALVWSMRNLYGVQPGEVWFTASDVGWVVGHSYIVYGPLLNGNTTILFEGKPVGTPDAGVFWRVVGQHKAVALFTAPTAFRAIKREDPQGALIGRYDLSAFRALFLAGERSDPDTLHWAESRLGVPVVDHWWQTETGWAICGNPLGIEPMPIKYGSCTKPMPGWDLRCLDGEGREVAPGDIGSLMLRLPLPPGALPTLWGADERYRQAYLSDVEGYYKTGDAGFVDAEGYVHVMTRTDDIINVAGHRLSTGGMEEVLADHPDVAECAVIGIHDDLKGQIPFGFLVLKSGVARPAREIVAEVVAMVRDRIGPVAAFKQAIVVDRLPKTRSGKILRGTMRKIADGETYKAPATIDDPAILGEIAAALKDAGIGRS
ncbi:MAG TPA: propionyl-CoA synthetase [Alphaproteobacteria bacterium]|nr:propionyl-CoA synthetase [Alphaproteobacteria bacterium]